MRPVPSVTALTTKVTAGIEMSVVLNFTINDQDSEKDAGAMLWYSKACFRVRKHGTHHPNPVIICDPHLEFSPRTKGKSKTIDGRTRQGEIPHLR
jgi:hypothetical protein